jgi:hypothetical protein
LAASHHAPGRAEGEASPRDPKLRAIVVAGAFVLLAG